MNRFREIHGSEFQDELSRWAGNSSIDIYGLLNEGAAPVKNEVTAPFKIAESRNARGTVICLETPTLKTIIPSAQSPIDQRKFAQWWAMVAVRSGYCLPVVDPVVFADLVRLRADAAMRVEFIFDTNAMISGVGHWLVRMLGPRADLVRTVVTDFEVQNFGDSLEWNVKKFAEYSSRWAFLSASRFLEHVPDPHPIWRRLAPNQAHPPRTFVEVKRKVRVYC